MCFHNIKKSNKNQSFRENDITNVNILGLNILKTYIYEETTHSFPL
jgi:hypothetical protein